MPTAHAGHGFGPVLVLRDDMLQGLGDEGLCRRPRIHGTPLLMAPDEAAKRARHQRRGRGGVVSRCAATEEPIGDPGDGRVGAPSGPGIVTGPAENRPRASGRPRLLSYTPRASRPGGTIGAPGRDPSGHWRSPDQASGWGTRVGIPPVCNSRAPRFSSPQFAPRPSRQQIRHRASRPPRPIGLEWPRSCGTRPGCAGGTRRPN